MKISPIQTYSRQISNTISFNGKINTKNSRCSNILAKGYKFYKEVTLINPQGDEVKGLAFVLDKLSSSSNNLKVLITDNNYYELGDVNADGHTSCPDELWCSIKNQTTHSPQMSSKWMRPSFPAKSASEGQYRHVGAQAYEVLENYLDEHYTNIKKLRINAQNSASFDFHIKCGFGDKSLLGEYDCYSISNYLEKNFKKQ